MGWVGENKISFWAPNELMWDGDINPEGLTAGGAFSINDKTKLSPTIGYFVFKTFGTTFNEDSAIYRPVKVGK